MVFLGMLKVKHIHFGYLDRVVLEDISFSAEKGNHIAVIGESGSGKSTLLKLLYGEYDLHRGSISWNEQQILGPKYNLVVGYDFMKYVAQEFDLMPFTTVEENIGEYLSNFYPDEKKRRTAELIEVVELQQVAKQKVKTLSGGQKQRVALARALAKQPEIVLLDEPFSHIDNFKKQSLRRNIFNFLKEKSITCIVATHDSKDVLGFTDKILVLHDKQIIAQGTSQELYKNPPNVLIASFFEEFNVIEGRIYYAHQLKVVDDSNFKAIVKQTYFNGDSWLVEAKYQSKSVYIQHHEFLEKNNEISFIVRNLAL